MPTEDKYDPARLLTISALIFVGILIFFVCTIIELQILDRGEANTESWAALTGIIGWVTGVASGIYNNRFGTTTGNARKDETIQNLTTAAATIASTAQATQQAAAGAAPLPPPAGKVDEVRIAADTVNVATNPPKGNP